MSHMGVACRLIPIISTVCLDRCDEMNLPSHRTANRLQSPAMSVVDVARLPQDARGDDPGPDELPEDARPPFPTSTHFHPLLHFRAVDLGAGDSPTAMPLSGDQPHENRKEQLLRDI